MASLSSPQISRRFLVILFWTLIAAVPFTYVAIKAVAFSRNIIFWDEFDTALDLILKIDGGAGWQEILQRLFAVNNEHRTVTSRVMFAVSYWLTGTVNFHVIGAIGNLFLVGACVILVQAAGDWRRRLQMAVVLAFLMFQLEHFESFFWSGASIDHFQVVTLAVGAVAALCWGNRLGVGVGAMLAVLATFTLAQGVVAWPVGAALLAQQRRWKSLGVWLGCAALAVGLFLYGFSVNPGHGISAFTLTRAGHILRYWFALLGGPLTLGDAGFAPWPGAVLLVIVGFLIGRGALAREPLAMYGALYAVGALGLVSLGRSEIASGDINSRYLVLGALAWALVIFVLLESAHRPAKPFLLLGWMTPALAVFALAANLKFAPLAEGYIEVRERAATAFLQHGRDGRGLMRLHPREGHADQLLKMAADRGVYRLQPLSKETQFEHRAANPRIVTYVDELLVNDRSVMIGGWAMLPGKLSKRGQVHVMLQSPSSTHFYSTITLQRPDVARAYKEPRWERSGFRAVIPRSMLPAEDFTVGVVIDDGEEVDFQLTKNRVELARGKDAVAVQAR